MPPLTADLVCLPLQSTECITVSTSMLCEVSCPLQTVLTRTGGETKPHKVGHNVQSILVSFCFLGHLIFLLHSLAVGDDLLYFCV